MQEQRVLLTLKLYLLAALVAGVVAGTGSPHVEAQTPAPDFSIEVKGANCDTEGINPTKCEVAAGNRFTVNVRINDLSGLPDLDEDTKAGYLSFQVRLNYSAGLTLKNGSEVTEVVWPDCGFPSEFKDVGSYLAFCAIDMGANESAFTGVVVEADFNCSQPPGSEESVTLANGPPIGPFIGDTFVIGEGGVFFENADETLTINCAPSVGGIAELPEVAGAPAEAGGSSGASMAVLAGIAIAAGTAGVVALARAGWYARRRRA